jgi:hypothetical protein
MSDAKTSELDRMILDIRMNLELLYEICPYCGFYNSDGTSKMEKYFKMIGEDKMRKIFEEIGLKLIPTNKKPEPVKPLPPDAAKLVKLYEDMQGVYLSLLNEKVKLQPSSGLMDLHQQAVDDTYRRFDNSRTQ